MLTGVYSIVTAIISIVVNFCRYCYYYYYLLVLLKYTYLSDAWPVYTVESDKHDSMQS